MKVSQRNYYTKTGIKDSHSKETRGKNETALRTWKYKSMYKGGGK